MTYRGHIEKGTVVLDEPISLPEGAKVEVALLETSEATPSLRGRLDGLGPDEELIPTLYERLESVIGIADGLPADFAANHDHYAHGRPKR